MSEVLIEVVEIARFAGMAMLKVLPAFLVSVGLGVLIRALELQGVIRRAFQSREGLSIVLATAVGAFSPFCSCTVIPVVTGLLLGGVPLAPVMAFWVASPTMDPEMFALTVATLGWPLAVTRLGATLVLSLGAGFVTLILTRAGLLDGDALRASVRGAAQPRLLARPLAVVDASGLGRLPIAGGSLPATPASACCAPATPPASTVGCCAPPPATPGSIFARLAGMRWTEFGRDLVVESVRLGRWLVLAFVLEAVILRHVPQASVAGALGTGSALAVPLAAVVGVPLYLNNVSALPIVSGLLAQGMQPGAALAFLIAGPVTTVPAMSAVWGIARPRVFGLYLGIALVGAMALGLLANLLLG